MLRATLLEPVPIQALVPDGRADLFVRARIYNAVTQALVTTVSPGHVADGWYNTTWTPSAEGFYAVIYAFFLDAGFTQLSVYESSTEDIEVSSDKTNLARLLCLEHENAVFDNQVYNVNGRLTGGRVRGYDSKANAQAAGATGLLFTWTIEAVYDITQKLTSYKILREP